MKFLICLKLMMMTIKTGMTSLYQVIPTVLIATADVSSSQQKEDNQFSPNAQYSPMDSAVRNLFSRSSGSFRLF